jgi:hypothetical protein
VTDKPVRVSMTRFADFCAASDPVAQLSKVRETRRQYEQPYAPSGDFWSRWRKGVESVHRRGAGRDELARIGETAKDNRGDQYTSAATGYRKFWGRKQIGFAGSLTPTVWRHERLEVKVNPEWLLTINDKVVVVKLHLKERLQLNQRLANPLLHLLESDFGDDERSVGLLDVHRGKLWTPTAESRSMDSVLRMQAAAFLVGWDAIERPAA